MPNYEFNDNKEKHELAVKQMHLQAMKQDMVDGQLEDLIESLSHICDLSPNEALSLKKAIANKIANIKNPRWPVKVRFEGERYLGNISNPN
jgi:hypothetical protein